MTANDVSADSLRLAAEAERIRDVYGRRQERGGPFDLYGLLALQERQRLLLLYFRNAGLQSLRGMNVLDVGCGAGAMLRRLAEFGAQPERCAGIDLRGGVLRGALRMNPNISFLECNAASLPFADESFDLVVQSTVFSSVQDAALRSAVADEMLRTLRPGGHIIWYDLARSNPGNTDVLGIGRAEVKRLFPRCTLRFHRVTLAPPLGRITAGISPTLCRTLWALPFMRTHDLCFARKWVHNGFGAEK